MFLTWNITERPVNETQNVIINIDSMPCMFPAFITPHVISNSDETILFATCKVGADAPKSDRINDNRSDKILLKVKKKST